MTELGFQDAWLISAIGFMIFINILGASFTWAKVLNKYFNKEAVDAVKYETAAPLSYNSVGIRGPIAIVSVATILNVVIFLLSLFRFVR